MNQFINNIYYLSDINKILESKLPWNLLSNKSILVTGATGMYGTMIIDVLMQSCLSKKSNLIVFALGRNRERAEQRFRDYFNSKNFFFIEQDIRNINIKKYHFDYIIHAASNAHPVAYNNDPIGTILTNVLGTNNILEYTISNNSCRVLYLSTIEIYGENKGKIKDFTEDSCGYINLNSMRSCYPESKRVCESLCQSYIANHSSDVLIARLCRTYGPTMTDSDSKATAQFFKNALKGEDIVLKSSGNQFFSYIYIADAVLALFTILLLGKTGEAYNVSSSGSNVNLKKFAAYLAKIVNRNVIFELNSNAEKIGPSLAIRSTMDSSKLMALGWHPMFDVPTGIYRTYEILKDCIIEK